MADVKNKDTKESFTMKEDDLPHKIIPPNHFKNDYFNQEFKR